MLKKSGFIIITTTILSMKMNNLNLQYGQFVEIEIMSQPKVIWNTGPELKSHVYD